MSAVPKIKFWRTASDGRWRFGLAGANGERQDQSEGYATRGSCLRGIAAARRNWAIAVVEETAEPAARVKRKR